MGGARLGMMRLASLVALSAVVFLPGLGRSGRLSYHEAFVAEGAREMLDSGSWWSPTIGGRPWLEKPPLPWWLTAGLGRCAGGVDETVARLPSVLAAVGLVLGVAVVAARHYGPSVGWLSGAIQATTAWTVIRGRLAEADVLLACLIAWGIVAFDTIRADEGFAAESAGSPPRWRRARWAFFVILGITCLVKGIGFGAVMILAVVAAVVLGQRGRMVVVRRLRFPAGWLVASGLAMAWPLAMVARHGSGALALWAWHVTDRLAAHPSAFAGERWGEYALGLLVQAMPWTPLALVGAGHSLRRAVLRRDAHGGLSTADRLPATVVAGDRLLWAWAVAPLALLSLATVKNAHYAISAQVPWSVWAALGLLRWRARLVPCGWTPDRLRRRAVAGFAALALAYGLGFWLLGPWLDRRGVEWAFYESAARQIPPDAALAVLYDDWDRKPYDSPFGAIPHDLAVRLFYLGRPASWHFHDPDRTDDSPPLDPGGREGDLGGTRTGARHPPSATYVIGRDRDRPALGRLCRVEVLARGPSVRWDRAFVLFRVTPGSDPLGLPAPVATKDGVGFQR